MIKRKLKAIGSVKDIYERSDGDLDLVFSDRYSVFDWGEMPDTINKKGEALAFMGKYFFEHLGTPSHWHNWKAPKNLATDLKHRIYQSKLLSQFKKTGLPHHYLSQAAPNELTVKKVFVPKGRDISLYQTRPIATLVPLEVVFRFGLPEGSSFLSRIKKRAYCRSLGLKGNYKEGDFFDRPVIEFFTKLEDSDRFLDYQEAKQIAGLSAIEFNELILTTQIIACELQKVFSKLKVELWDGKLEYSFIKGPHHRQFQLVDSIGPDELRLRYNQRGLSKEYLRQQYNKTGWYKNLEACKQANPMGWRREMIESSYLPPNLPPHNLETFKHMYLGICNEICREQKRALRFDPKYNLSVLGAKR
jgi:phosphoribosylaminoimidazole-succinocarboxamide synthase